MRTTTRSGRPSEGRDGCFALAFFGEVELALKANLSCAASEVCLWTQRFEVHLSKNGTKNTVFVVFALGNLRHSSNNQQFSLVM